MTEAELTAAVHATKARLAELDGMIAPLKARLLAATTHENIATAEDYARGWDAAAAVRVRLDPLLDEQKRLRSYKMSCINKIDQLRFYGAMLKRKGVARGERIQVAR